MKRLLFVMLFLLVLISAAYAQDDEDYDNSEIQYQIYNDPRWFMDYYVDEDGIWIGGRPTTEEERLEIDLSKRHSASGDVNRTGTTRIEPTWDIGLFIDPDLFDKTFKKTNVFDYVYEQNTFDYTAPSKVAISVKEYRIEGDAAVLCFMNKYNKIHGIRITMAPWYLLRDDCFEMYELVGIVLWSTGLLVSNKEYYDATSAIQNNESDFLGPNYYIKRYINDTDLTVDISSLYDVYQDLTPYNLMDVFEEPCDTNYVGGCVPIVNYDLDCSDIIYRNFFVINNDKHHFDGDGNGVCCEPSPQQ